MLLGHIYLPDRMALSVFGVSIYWYGICVAAAFMLGMLIMDRYGKKIGVSSEQVLNLAFTAIIGGLVGARLFYVFFAAPEQFSGNLFQIINIRDGGLVFFGGFLGATASVLVLLRLRGLQLANVADIFALALPAGQLLGRIGCLLNGCCHGKPTEGFGVIYPGTNDAMAWWPNASPPLIPTQFYQGITNLAVFGILLLLARQFGKRRGQLFPCYMILYGMGRFMNEFNRGDYPPDKLWHFLGYDFTPAQQVCLVLVPLGIAALLYIRLRPAPPAEQTVDAAEKTAKVK